MKILFAVQNFRQGWGGAPESVRLMANQLATLGITADVFDVGCLRRNVGELTVLPEPGTPAEPFPFQTVTSYSAILQTGPWQNAWRLGQLISRKTADQALYYLPRGGLGKVEFGRPKDIKKIPYLSLIEGRFIDAADGMVFSSEVEQRETVKSVRRRVPEHVIPDFVSPPRPRNLTPDRDVGVVTFAFLAEISPRKGLLPLVEAFVQWVIARGLDDRVRLIVGGAPRPGCEAYLEAVRAVHRPVSDRVKIEFRGAVPHGEREAFYNETDAMVVASSFESFGLTVIEALNEGCVVLSTGNIGALQYLPYSEGVVRMAGSEVADMVSGLEHAMAVATGWESPRRKEQQAFAGATVAAINSTALEAWAKLLNVKD